MTNYNRPSSIADRVEAVHCGRRFSSSGGRRKLLGKAFDGLPEGPHQQIASIKGIGKQTAAAIVATTVSIDRFETAGKLIGYYGVFPEEWQSGVDKFGNPVPTGKKIMCRKGNDLVRELLWQCAKCASAENGGNPAVRAL